MAMEYVYAALLLHKTGQKIDEDSIKNVVKAAGVEPDDVKVKALVSALAEINIDEALKSTPLVAAPSAAAPAEAKPAEAKPKEEKKEKEEEEKKGEEEAMAGLSALFG
ncbi:MAG: 50S ribosomal protein P1 [Candidatus Nitrosocaldus sp.]|nr:50S ribosomal protein P1 [Candidatus Nitrosocaldus sp.]MCS7141305.1 50S ribosomal protein P1 [Candidatus Nitrosocaldus sp.]MDW8000270.1 50S ribosomal protein P1 [Candidatus Nitrosocaldus sp.]MDW8276143.1 50S ribosomal protein P1 [Candidatus Nitrosocaldus sp.]